MAKAQKAYWEKLRDPRWQQMRLRVMERDGFECRNCGSATDTLNVHHGYYEKDKEPWDYPAESLITLCEKCHKEREQLLLAIRRRLTHVNLNCASEVLGYLAGKFLLSCIDDEFDCRVEINNLDEVSGLADAIGVKDYDVLPLIDPEHCISTMAIEQLKEGVVSR